MNLETSVRLYGEQLQKQNCFMKRETDGVQTPCVTHRIHITSTTTTNYLEESLAALVGRIIWAVATLFGRINGKSIGIRNFIPVKWFVAISVFVCQVIEPY